ncbi:hypothetical protein QVD17_15781 [Tagetes erecta]|uniref:Mitochondrial glycoprotein n=1 Tax=Tagetes erecta TaxID=13708 RepID=A0AAD8NYW5_TARER|nr:hypothetical protein QVD17_15781 [Tagetes erecta]
MMLVDEDRTSQGRSLRECVRGELVRQRGGWRGPLLVQRVNLKTNPHSLFLHNFNLTTQRLLFCSSSPSSSRRNSYQLAMSKFATLLQKGKRALQDLELLKVLQAEIKYELSNDLYKNEIGSLGDFVIDWNSPHSKDIIMRKKCESGEEIAISALLGEETFVEDNLYPKEANMKVCVKKNGLSSILKFDCKVLDEGQNKVDFHIQNAYFLKSPTDLGSSVYKGPLFSELDPELQQELKRYLISRGIQNSLAAYLLHQIHRKEQDQYVKWLQKLEGMVSLR